jgi:hypothetical protein
MRAEVELVIPDDKRRFLLQVRLNDEWIGDLLFSSIAERAIMLGALTEGAVSVVRRPIPIADLSIVDAAARWMGQPNPPCDDLAPDDHWDHHPG